MSVSQDDFLKTIYHISFEEHREVTSSELARRLSISNAAVTDMARKLSSQGAVSYKKYKALKLTEKGERKAVELIRKHRLWETFLNKVLGFSEDEVHKEAEMLEHSTSDTLLNKIDEFLDHPEFDPHGDPIPGRTGEIPKQPGAILLRDCGPGTYEILRLQHRHEEISLFMAEHGFHLGQTIELTQIMTQSKSMAIKINDLSLVITNEFAENIYVRNIR
jgi:DtxR family Mn-dependent transcriptional regulator